MRASFLGAFAAGLIASQVCAERLKARSWLDATPHQFSALLKENDVVLVSCTLIVETLPDAES